MGQIRKRLYQRLRSAEELPTEPRWRPGEPLPGVAKDAMTLIMNGVEPFHALYAHVQQVALQFAEVVAQLPELNDFARLAGTAEEEFQPVGPPMSPLTVGYFSYWRLFDLRFGREGDTIGRCLIDAWDLVGLNAEQLRALRKLATSRMGMYEHVGWDGGLVQLRELVTGDEFPCYSTSGYQGQEGELWFVRRVPPLMPELTDHHVLLTTPYVLIESTKSDWLQYFRRTLVKRKPGGERPRLQRLMKYGPTKVYWNQFIRRAFHHHQENVIFLAGIPDIKSSLPHA